MSYTVLFTYQGSFLGIEADSEEEAERIVRERLKKMPTREIGDYLETVEIESVEEE